MSKRTSLYRVEEQMNDTNPPFTQWKLKLEAPRVDAPVQKEGRKQQQEEDGEKGVGRDGKVALGFCVRRWAPMTDSDSEDLDYEIEDDGEEFGTDVKEQVAEVVDEVPPPTPVKMSLFTSEVPAVTKPAHSDPSAPVPLPALGETASLPAETAPSVAREAPVLQANAAVGHAEEKMEGVNHAPKIPAFAGLQKKPDMERHSLPDVSMGDALVAQVDAVGSPNEPVLLPIHDNAPADLHVAMSDPVVLPHGPLATAPNPVVLHDSLPATAPDLGHALHNSLPAKTKEASQEPPVDA